jgi:polyphosphate kinase
LQSRFKEVVDHELEHARGRRSARIIVKNNAVADQSIIKQALLDHYTAEAKD